jgi:hypothetical protein
VKDEKKLLKIKKKSGLARFSGTGGDDHQFFMWPKVNSLRTDGDFVTKGNSLRTDGDFCYQGRDIDIAKAIEIVKTY